MRVLHFLDTEQFAGTEQHVITLLKQLSLSGVECGLLCKQSNTEFVSRADAIPNVIVFAEARNKRQIIVKFRRCVLDWKPDVIHTHNGSTSLMAARLGSRSPKRVFTQHFVDPAHTNYKGIKHFVAKIMHGYVNVLADKIIAVSEAARLAMIEREILPASKTVTIWNGIEPPQINAGRAQSILIAEAFDTHPLFVTTARLAPEKGYRTLLDAVPIVLEQFPEAGFVWIGGGELEQELRQSIVERGLQNSVLILGYQDNATDFLAAADAFILPSDCEPFGLVLVEAMMCGVPVIGTDCGGAKEIITPAVEYITGENAVGWLVPPQNPQALATAIIECATYTELAKSIGQNGRQRALTHFTAERMARQTLAIYEGLTD